MKRFLASILIFTIACGPVFADTLAEGSYIQLYDAGVKAAKEDYCPLPSAAGGFLTGLFVPLVGPVALVSLSSLVKPETPSRYTDTLAVQDREAFAGGYTDTRLAYRRRSFLASGIAGTALVICFILALPGMISLNHG